MKQHTSVAADWGKNSRRSAVKSERKSVAHKGVQRRFCQFVICGAVFVVLVIVKLLLPSKIEPLSERITQMLQQNVDVQAVFSTVGDMVLRELPPEKVMEEVYQAVFMQDDMPAQQMIRGEELLENGAAWECLRSYRRERDEVVGQEEISELAYVLYSDENMPDNVILEQKILGFDYCIPVSAQISSPFGYREHPMQGEERFHYGVDLAADSGTAIACFAGGEVSVVGESSSYGKYCIVTHANDYRTLYAHCSRIAVSSGEKVMRGEKLGEVGETGMATGPHLHFELQHGGMYLNPTYYVAL